MIGTRSGTLLPSCAHNQPLATFRVAQFFKIHSQKPPQYGGIP